MGVCFSSCYSELNELPFEKKTTRKSETNSAQDVQFILQNKLEIASHSNEYGHGVSNVQSETTKLSKKLPEPQLGHIYSNDNAISTVFKARNSKHNEHSSSETTQMFVDISEIDESTKKGISSPTNNEFNPEIEQCDHLTEKIIMPSNKMNVLNENDSEFLLPLKSGMAQSISETQENEFIPPNLTKVIDLPVTKATLNICGTSSTSIKNFLSLVEQSSLVGLNPPDAQLDKIRLNLTEIDIFDTIDEDVQKIETSNTQTICRKSNIAITVAIMADKTTANFLFTSKLGSLKKLVQEKTSSNHTIIENLMMTEDSKSINHSSESYRSFSITAPPESTGKLSLGISSLNRKSLFKFNQSNENEVQNQPCECLSEQIIPFSGAGLINTGNSVI